jgi:hypothetical protein
VMRSLSSNTPTTPIAPAVETAAVEAPAADIPAVMAPAVEAAAEATPADDTPAALALTPAVVAPAGDTPADAKQAPAVVHELTSIHQRVKAAYLAQVAAALSGGPAPKVCT